MGYVRYQSGSPATVADGVAPSFNDYIESVLAGHDSRVGSLESNSLTVLIYASGAYPVRPSVPAGHVRYVGPVQPTDWLSGDEWINNS